MSIDDDKTFFLDIDINDLNFKKIDKLLVPIELFQQKGVLTLTEILIYSMILNHYDPLIHGVMSANFYFAKKLKLSKSQVRKIINSLADKGFLKIIKIVDKYYVKGRLLQPKDHPNHFFDIP